MTLEEVETEDDPIKHAPLKSYVKSQTPEMWEGEEMWANDEAIDMMQDQLLLVARLIWQQAAKDAHQDGYRTVGPDYIDDSFNEVMHPQNLLQEAANEMERLRWDFLDVAKQSPAIEYDKDE
ncbi:hypothetical protein EGO51_13225 [Haloarcula hispanica]|uniref:Uncharacterized protein n=1 Tax=Haloarcula hispanica TaxID=51589 RepID=A0A5J5LMT9_HALHI|nr:hypothetical protein [Haloarcula hispanica]KAA9410722.1 hypothetical protein EGO51_13225 [Haloarcula hispanica]